MNNSLILITTFAVISCGIKFYEDPNTQIDYRFLIDEFGGFEVGMHDCTVTFKSSISYPGGWNKLGYEASRDAENHYIVHVKRINKKKYSVFVTGRYYEIIRTIELLDNKISVTDKIANKHANTLGCIVSNSAISENKSLSVFLAGNPADSFPQVLCCAENPTVFFGFKNCGLGVVLEDDIYRLQAKLSYEDGIVEFKTDQFGLAGNNSYTLRWSIYPMNYNNYYDFINLLRNEWHIKTKIEGPFCFLSANAVKNMDYAELTKRLDSQNIKIIALSPWVNYYKVVDGLTKEKFRLLMRKAADKIHKVNPSIKVLGRIHPAMVCLNKNTQNVPYVDARIITEDGEHYYSEYYSKIVFKEKFDKGWRIYYYYPMTNNSFLKKLEEDIDLCMDSIGLDGIYFDEFSFAFRRDEYVRYTYDRWDEHTVNIDEVSGKVKRKKADLGLITIAARRQLVDKIISKSGICLVNTAPATLSMQNLEILRFVETAKPESYCKNCSKVHLTTPIGLGFPLNKLPLKNRTTQYIMKDIKAKLEKGLLYYYYSLGGKNPNILNYLFPIVPMEIYSGTIIGENKIITCRSGRYEWMGHHIRCVWICDESGNVSQRKAVLAFDKESTSIDIKLSKKEIAVIEEIPVQVKSTEIPTRVLLEEYSGNKIVIKFLAGSASGIAIEDKRLKVENDMKYTLMIISGSNHFKQSVSSGKSILIFNNNFKKGDNITIERIDL